MTSRMAGRLLVTVLLLAPFAARADSDDKFPFLEATVAQLQAEMAAGRLSSEQLTRAYIERIHDLDSRGPGVNSIMELNPDALAMARKADEQRRHGVVLGPLHGIPVLLKDNIDTGDRLQTSAGSFALVGTPALRDSTVAANLRAGGAVILGKTTLSEWANFRSFESISGWSGRGGQAHNPYGIDRNPCGSSSGSAAAASSNFATVSFGSETDGSIVCPGNASGVVAIKPTVGLTSRAGVVPISHTQDTVGPHARTVADAAAALSVIQSRTFDGRDPATGGVPLGWRGRFVRPNIPVDYTQFLNPHGLQGARIGITRVGLSGFTNVTTPAAVTAAIEAAFKVLSDAGATVIDLDAAGFTFTPAAGETGVLLYDFKNDVRAYFATRVGVPVAGGTLQTAIDFNNAHADVEMPFFNQDIFDQANSLNTTDPNAPQDPALFGSNAAGMSSYNIALQLDQAAGVSMDQALSMFHLEAVVSATDNPAWSTDLLYGDHFIYGTSSLAAGPGYPIVQVPAGEVFGVPLGISFFGTAFSEPTLIRLASGYEAVSQARAHNLPTFAATVPFDHVKGPLQQAAADEDRMQAGLPAASAAAVQGAPAVAGAAAAPNQATKAKTRKALHHL
ncbi:MAG TPA: amidase family protein [Steroidobacteraceae bacterium]|jgi:amidase|nr:amidase family protein [Steroidobacteraceae bacterium]